MLRTVGTVSALLFTTATAFAGNDNSEQIAKIKAQIVGISEANTTRVDNFSEVRAQLQPLVDQLVSLAPQRTEAQKLDQVVGAWQNLWTDMYFGPTVDLTETYQVVARDGFYYNIARNVAGDSITTDFLRGSFADQGDHLGILFTREFVTNSWLANGSDLVQVAADAESGKINGTDVIDSRAVGVKGTLQNTYVDEDLRVVTGESQGSTQDNMFVLSKVTTN